MYAKGPWEMCDVEAWKDLETKRFSLRVNNAKKGAVAYSSGRTCTEATDNARLIAAAPELLEVCRRVLACLEHKAVAGHFGGSITALRAAIAKAVDIEL